MNKHILSFLAGAVCSSIVFVSVTKRHMRRVEKYRLESMKDFDALLEAAGVVYEKAMSGEYRDNPQAARSDIKFFTIANRNKE